MPTWTQVYPAYRDDTGLRRRVTNLDNWSICGMSGD